MRKTLLNTTLHAVKDACSGLLDEHSVIVYLSYSYISTGKGFADTLTQKHDAYYQRLPEKIRGILNAMALRGDQSLKKLIGSVGQTALPIGHSCSGTVIATGDKVSTVRVGDVIACGGDGLAAHQQVVVVPETLIAKLPHENLLKPASLTAIGAIAMHTIRRANLGLGDIVVVYGLGTLGQLIVQLAAESGAQVIAVANCDKRLKIAEEAGAKETVNTGQDSTDQDSVGAAVSFLSGGYGADVALITPDMLEESIVGNAVEVVRQKGRIVVAGAKMVHCEQVRADSKEIDILFSSFHGPGRYDHGYEYGGNDYPYAYVRWTEQRNMQLFIALLEQQRITVDHLLSDEVTENNFSPEYVNDHIHKPNGVLLKYEEHQDAQTHSHSSEQLEARYTPARKSSLAVGFYGMNTFMAEEIMPILNDIRNVTIGKIIDTNIRRSATIAHRYRGATVSTGDAHMLYDDATDVVFMANTPTNPIAYKDVRAALEHRKVVVLKQPMHMNPKESDELHALVRNETRAQLLICYHRSFSPFILKIKDELKGRKTPVIIHYRMNLGKIDSERLHRSGKQGKIITRASHIMDVFCTILDSKPVSVSVDALAPSNNLIFPTENFTAQVTFADGSICSLLLTSLGNKESGEERMEVFYENKTIVMEDFIRLTGFGLPQTFDEIVRIPDRGHEAMLKVYFGDLIKQKNSHKEYCDRWHAVRTLTWTIDQLACKSGGEEHIAV